ncbi:hypothetical protein L596_019633 [Steinernema carpocapsae]|uniref:Uncharacterized protein n=1 Tax=Steinernema carpocapsae TaxID=34508 RepID=A0A4V6A0M6_STECR|nr:hypothetical protein L596_019633 [Steinernema carpocapsae]
MMKRLIAAVAILLLLQSTSGTEELNEANRFRYQCNPNPPFQPGSFNPSDEVVEPVLLFVDDYKVSALKRNMMRYQMDSVLCRLLGRMRRFSVKIVERSSTGRLEVLSLPQFNGHSLSSLAQRRTLADARESQTDALEYDDLPVKCSDQARIIVDGLASTEDGQKWLNYSLSFKQIFAFDETGAKCDILLDLKRKGWHLAATRVGKRGNDANDLQMPLQRVYGAANDNEAFFKKWADLTAREIGVSHVVEQRSVYEQKLKTREISGEIKRLNMEDFYNVIDKDRNQGLEEKRNAAMFTITNGICLLLTVLFTLSSSVFLCAAGGVQFERLMNSHNGFGNRLYLDERVEGARENAVNPAAEAQ